MSYPPAKRQRSNTSQQSANHAPPTAAPGLRQPHPQLQENAIPAAALYTAATAYGNGHGPYSTPSPVRQALDYGTSSPSSSSYPSNPVTTAQAKGYAGGYQTHAHTHAHAHAHAHTHAHTHTHSHHAPGMSYGETYSPQLAIRNHNFAPQYQQQAYPTKPDTSQGIQYTQSAINGNHNHNQNQSHASFARALESEIIRTYSPAPPTPQSATHPQAQPQNSFVQYGETYTSQPAAHMTAYRSNTSPYPDSTINPQYSPPPPQPPPPPLPQQSLNGNLNGNGQNLEDPEGNDSEDALGEAADDPTEFYPNPEPPNAPSPDISEQPPETKCACKKGRGKKKACSSCQCTKYGRACSAQCACGDACGNPFADLTLFFGPPETFLKPCGANLCFATWLSNQPNIEELDMDLMVDMMLYDDTSWANIRSYTPAFAKWEASWTKARNGKGKKNREERERLEFELLRGGLGNCNQNDFNGFFYSFCKSGWVLTDDWEHCQECRQCKTSMEWHCEKHNQCTTNRMCPGCHANAAYPDMMAYTEAGS